ncbi:MAG: phosphatase PAP2 family protein [Bacteroidota bacterium]|nr:phosphatase PAP2 family protein [Bacteroidota bacterium]
MYKYVFISVLMISPFSRASAQQVNRNKDSSRHDYAVTAIPTKTFLHRMVLPATFVLYGVFSLNNSTLLDWNEDAQKRLVAANGNYTHLDNYIQYLPAVAGHVLSIAGVKGKHKLFDRLMIDGMAAAIATTVIFTVKRTSRETRPDLSDPYSFPSGHTATAFASAELLRQEYSDVSPWYGIAGYGVAALTGYLRMYNNKHWLGDVVAGAGVGILSAQLANQFYPLVRKILFHNKTPFAVILPTWQQGGPGVHMFYSLP